MKTLALFAGSVPVGTSWFLDSHRRCRQR